MKAERLLVGRGRDLERDKSAAGKHDIEIVGGVGCRYAIPSLRLAFENTRDHGTSQKLVAS